MQSLNILNAVVFIGQGSFAIIDLLNYLIAVLLKIGSVSEITDNLSERVAKVNASSN